ncbi:MAG: segregation/condensation protein A [Candidatus Edwardsbacteria bacterium]|nr:segregation/condensation protein A [Candidatus Edwardsbacteria bacterium]MBU1576142.1 segregation/condensation protein A [Candidatus Edwardsbacteria bacterium]MBU2464226.1 segregation/condensation protein A [Candidatus Edwardsbacteria bacterium]MBU2593182.1 segregation/condensation protein A [Candidatus Edwardsbacteria bacterium]
MSNQPYQVKLEIFEGPLDLLLYLIRQEELDIYDIPIARITQQYLEYIEIMKALDIDLAGEFLVMAATLLKIKSKLLLPHHVEIEGEMEDPRKDLVRQLLEYKKFKEAASRLEDREEVQRLMFPRPKGAIEKQEEVQAEPPVPEVGLYELLSAFRQVVERIDKVRLYEIVGEDITIEDRIDFILKQVMENEQMNFSDLFAGERRKLVIVVTFFALLELIRLGRVRVVQDALFGEIIIRKAGGQMAIKPESQ